MTTIAQVKSLNLKLTPQRLAVVEFLEGNKDHPSALDVYQAVSLRFPNISFATVYNILETFRANNILREITIDSERKRFDPNPEPHHHLICTQCRSVKDVHITFDPVLLPYERHGFEVTGLHVDFYGICARCRQKAALAEHTN